MYVCFVLYVLVEFCNTDIPWMIPYWFHSALQFVTLKKWYNWCPSEDMAGWKTERPKSGTSRQKWTGGNPICAMWCEISIALCNVISMFPIYMSLFNLP